MKRLFLITLVAFTALSFSVKAIEYTDVVITPTENTLLTARPALGSLLPADFLTTVFDGSNNPTMDRLYIFMTMPSISDFTISSPYMACTIDLAEGEPQITPYYPSITLSSNSDVLFSFKVDGNGYVLDTLPFDPTARALAPVKFAAGTSNNIYVTGSVSDKLSAELPERVEVYGYDYLNPLKQGLSDMLVAQLHDQIDNSNFGTEENPIHFENFTFNPNTEGFFSFTGGESTNVDLYLDGVSIGTKDKQTDFLGTLIGTQLTLNLYGLDFTEDEESILTHYTNEELEAMTEDDVHNNITSEQIKIMPASQLKIIGNKMNDWQVEQITPRQICALLGDLNILEAFDLAQNNQTEFAKRLAFFGSEGKINTVGNTLANVPSQIMDAIRDQISTSGIASSLFTMFDVLFSSLVEGSASPFAFMSNSEQIDSKAFNVNIHSKSTNTITGGAQGVFKNVGVEMSLIAAMANKLNDRIGTMIGDLATMFQAMIHFTSAPIAVRPSATVVKAGDVDTYKYTCTRFNFDDFWVDGNTTNGLLCLPVEGVELDAPSIDLGTANGQAIFNGGRYKLHTPVSNKKKNMFYVATMAICYRELRVTMPAIASFVPEQNITYTGVGTSVGWGPGQNRTDSYRNVIIKDGTFTTYSAEAWKDPARGENAVDGVANGWYQHYTDLRMPYNTSILGGTFPEDTYVYRCDAAAEQGVPPVFIYIKDPNDPTSPQYLTALCERKELIANVDLADPSDATNEDGTVKVTDENKLLLEIKNGENSTTTQEYGTNSLTADDNGRVYVYVTGDCAVTRDYMRNYVTALAPFGERHSAGGAAATMLMMGGDVEVKNLYQERFDMKNAYLLYTQLGYYTYYNAGVNIGGLRRTLIEEFQMDRDNHHNFSNTGSEITAGGNYIMTTTDTAGVVFSQVTNDDSYTIQYGIYSMLPAISDTWMMLSMPFDVANVYILETTSEQPKSPRQGWTNTDYHNFFVRQGEADGDMAQTLVTTVLPDIFSGRGSGILKPLPDILTQLTNSETKLTKLKHYDGTWASMMTANYYLNIMQSDVAGKNLWEQQDEQKEYGKKWKVAPQQTKPTFVTEKVPCDVELNPLCEDTYETIPYTDQYGKEQTQQWCVMKRDSVYAIYLPGGANRWYDYKYLIFEGYGPQQINGAYEHSHFAASSGSTKPEDGYIALQGNTTFANATVSGTIFVPTKQDGIFNAGSADMGTKPQYLFTEKSGSSHRILPTGVYMVSSDGNITKSSMPLLSTVEQTNDDNSNLPKLIDKSMYAWTDNGIYMHAFQAQDITIFSIDGRVVWQGSLQENNTTFAPVGAGMYIIQGEESSVKVIVR